MSERSCQPNFHDPPYHQAATQNRVHCLITIVKMQSNFSLQWNRIIYMQTTLDMTQTQQYVNMPHFQTGKLTQVITSSFLFTWAEIMSFSVCRQMGVELLRYHTYTLSLISTHSRTHNIGSQPLCLGREVANQIFFSGLAYGTASSSEQSFIAMKSGPGGEGKFSG